MPSITQSKLVTKVTRCSDVDVTRSARKRNIEVEAAPLSYFTDAPGGALSERRSGSSLLLSLPWRDVPPLPSTHSKAFMSASLSGNWEGSRLGAGVSYFNERKRESGPPPRFDPERKDGITTKQLRDKFQLEATRIVPMMLLKDMPREICHGNVRTGVNHPRNRGIILKVPAPLYAGVSGSASTCQWIPHGATHAASRPGSRYSGNLRSTQPLSQRTSRPDSIPKTKKASRGRGEKEVNDQPSEVKS